MQEDPLESRNLIFSEQHQSIAAGMRDRLFATLERTGGMQMPLYPDKGQQMSHRDPRKSHAADFADELYKPRKIAGPLNQ